ncbi:MAG: cold shock domain-containing protein [Bdellovibrionales bacterium]
MDTNSSKGSASPTVCGIVKWFNEAKGFGFIEQENGRDLFVHYKECRGKIKQGDKVEYVLGEGKKGPCATKVKVKVLTL